MPKMCFGGDHAMGGNKKRKRILKMTLFFSELPQQDPLAALVEKDVSLYVE